MGILRNAEAKIFFPRIGRGIAVLITGGFLMLSMGCSTFTSSVFFVAQSKGPLIHEVERNDWITTNQGYGTVRPPLKAVDINGAGKLTIYPVLTRGHIEMFGPPLLPVIWIPEFMCLPPLDPLNVLHFAYTGNSEDIHIESINDIPINPDCVKREECEGEAHFFLSIPDSNAKKDTLNVNISVRKDTIYLEFNKSRSKNWFPLIVPL